MLSPKQLIAKLTDPYVAEPAEMNDALVKDIHRELENDTLVVVMGAGDVDKWLREHLHQIVD